MTFICKSIKKYLYWYQWLRTYLRFQTDVWGNRDILYYIILYAYAWYKLLASSASHAGQATSQQLAKFRIQGLQTLRSQRHSSAYEANRWFQFSRGEIYKLLDVHANSYRHSYREFLIYCSISKGFYLQWKAFDLPYNIRYILWLVALLGGSGVTNNGRRLGFFRLKQREKVIFCA